MFPYNVNITFQVLQSYLSSRNSHMLMMDNNNIEIADIILKWINKI